MQFNFDVKYKPDPASLQVGIDVSDSAITAIVADVDKNLTFTLVPIFDPNNPPLGNLATTILTGVANLIAPLVSPAIRAKIVGTKYHMMVTAGYTGNNVSVSVTDLALTQAMVAGTPMLQINCKLSLSGT